MIEKELVTICNSYNPITVHGFVQTDMSRLDRQCRIHAVAVHSGARDAQSTAACHC